MWLSAKLQQTPTWSKLSYNGYRHFTKGFSTTWHKSWYICETNVNVSVAATGKGAVTWHLLPSAMKSGVYYLLPNALKSDVYYLLRNTLKSCVYYLLPNTLKSGVYHLLPMCHVYIKVIIMFSASEGSLFYFVKSLRYVPCSIVTHISDSTNTSLWMWFQMFSRLFDPVAL